jgi:hypothetical protein
MLEAKVKIMAAGVVPYLLLRMGCGNCPERLPIQAILNNK